MADAAPGMRVTFSLRTTDAYEARVRAVADRLGLTAAAAMRQALDDWLARNDPAQEGPK